MVAEGDFGHGGNKRGRNAGVPQHQNDQNKDVFGKLDDVKKVSAHCPDGR